MAGSSHEQSFSVKDSSAEDERFSGDEKDARLKADKYFSECDAYYSGRNTSEVVRVDSQLRKESFKVKYLQGQSAGSGGSLKNQENCVSTGNMLTRPVDQTEQPRDEHLSVQDNTTGRQKPLTCQATNVDVNMDGHTQIPSRPSAAITDVNVGSKIGFESVKFQETAVTVSALGMERMPNIGSGVAEGCAGVSLRAWLNNPSRVIDTIESLHVFKQITKFVDIAHCEGVVLRNVRPSSFLLSSTSQVSIIEFASSDSNSESSAESTGRATILALADDMNQVENKGIELSTEEPFLLASNSCQKVGSEPQTEIQNSLMVQEDWKRDMEHLGSRQGGADDQRRASLDEECKSLTSSSCDHQRSQDKEQKFPLKQLLSLESMWYQSPEDLNGGTGDFPSDVYSLGVLFLELFYKPASQGEWSRAMSDLRHRLLPPSLLLEHSKLAAFCLLLLHPNPDCRPKAREILHADIFNEVEDKLAEKEAIMNLEEKLTEAETTLDFLMQMQQEKRIFLEKLARELNSLNHDIKEVEKWRALLMKNRRWGEESKQIILRCVESEQSFSKHEGVDARHYQDGPDSRTHEFLLAKSAQLMKSFTTLKEAYLCAIKKEYEFGGEPSQGKKANGMPSFFPNFSSSTGGHGDIGGRLGSFFDDLCKFLKYRKLEIKATLQYGDILNTKNMVCSLNFDCEDEFFATAGVSRRIKIFQCNALLEESDDMHYPVAEINGKSKLSCVCWHRFRKSHLASSDLEGAVQLWDVTAGQRILDFKEHGKCAWSVDFSHSDPSRLASGSDDGCVKLWSSNQGTSVGTIRTKANVCSVQFSPDNSHLLAFGSADSQIYLHDLRFIRIPVSILTGHQKTVSFVKFAGSSSVVSASTDNTLKLWDLANVSRKVRGHGTSFRSRSECVTTYTGHTNVKNFVGLSVAEGSYIACGSETNEVFVYHKSSSAVMLSHNFGNVDPILGQEFEDAGDKFVSSVCWRGKSQVLVTANSVGNIQVLEMV